jgi:hypothetical protein
VYTRGHSAQDIAATEVMVAQRVRMKRLDVILILILVVAGASTGPVASELVAVAWPDRAPREFAYQARHDVQALRIRAKGLDDQLGKVREKVVEQRLDAKTIAADVERVEQVAHDYEAAVLQAMSTLAAAEDAAARAHARDLRRHQWKTMGVAMLVAAGINVVLFALFVGLAHPLLALGGLSATWSRVLPISIAIVMLATGYQAGQLSGLIALVLLLTVGGAIWLLLSALLQPASEVVEP